MDTQGHPTWGEMDILRDDRIEVSGMMRSAAVTGGTAATAANDNLLLGTQALKLTVSDPLWSLPVTNVFLPTSAADTEHYLNGYAGVINGQPVPNSWRVLADLPTYYDAFGNAYAPGGDSV